MSSAGVAIQACAPRSSRNRFYRPRDHEASPLFRVVREHFEEFERVYAERFQQTYGFWRSVIRTSIEKFLKCGDVKEGFCRVRCLDCGEEFFVAHSCRQRGCCPSCDQKRALILGQRLVNEVLAPVRHRQFVLTIPKRLRLYFRFDRSLLGKLCQASYETIRRVYQQELQEDDPVPGLVAFVQTFGNLANFHPHLHCLVTEGVFMPGGHFVSMRDIPLQRFTDMWREQVFELLLKEQKITEEVVESMRAWEHTGFSIDNSVGLEAGNHDGISRLVAYMARCPVSLRRIVRVNEDGHVLYRAANSNCLPFPMVGNAHFRGGTPRNFEVFDPLLFLAEFTQHIPNKGEHLTRYFGFYSNKNRGMRQKHKQTPDSEILRGLREPDNAFTKKRRLTWATLLRLVYEIEPLKCPICGGTMRIISFIEQHQKSLVEKILRHCGLWKESPARPPPTEIHPVAFEEPAMDYGFFDRVCI